MVLFDFFSAANPLEYYLKKLQFLFFILYKSINFIAYTKSGSCYLKGTHYIWQPIKTHNNEGKRYFCTNMQ